MMIRKRLKRRKVNKVLNKSIKKRKDKMSKIDLMLLKIKRDKEMNSMVDTSKNGQKQPRLNLTKLKEFCCLKKNWITTQV